jgi:protein gp37
VGETTKIAWTDSTSNAWHGCAKVDQLCAHCYAEVSTPVRVKRAKGLELWGVHGGRSETKGWERDLRRWNAAALASGEIHHVFGQSLADTFESYHGRVYRADGRTDPTLDDLRTKYLSVIWECDALTFQLLTKRPENVKRMVPPSWLTDWPAHVWIGASGWTAERIAALRAIPATTRFLSFEPLYEVPGVVDLTGIAWVIVGGESGPKARPFDLAWARSIRDQCKAAGVAYFCKQLGAHPMTTWEDIERGFDFNVRFHQSMPGSSLHRLALNDSHGADPAEWPEDLRVQQFPP